MLTAAARLLRALPAIVLLSAPLCAAPVVAPFFNGVFPAQAPGLTGWQVVNAFPNLSFRDPIWIAQVPGSNDMVVVEKAGRILRFPRNPAATAAEVSVVLDITSLVQTSEDQGLYRIAFHPKFGGGGPHAAEVFVSYSHRPAEGGAEDRSMWRLSRFSWQVATGAIDPASEEVLIQQYDPNRWHNGGALDFDNHGFLLVTCGDGGGANEQFGLAQKLDGGFFGGVLRIDVDRDSTRSHPIRRQPVSSGKPAGFPADLSQGYFIPNDNPWQDSSGALLEEFYALGLRSPHSAHYDPPTGDLWVGDVGQDLQEELTRVRKGENHQWPYKEGALGGPKGIPSPHYGTQTPPVYSYGRTTGGCIIGGMRYRGTRWSEELGGIVIFGDFRKGSLSAFDPVSGGAPRELVPNIGGNSYSSFANICTDSQGEIYLPKLGGTSPAQGMILMLAEEPDLAEAPQFLSQTGLFTDTAALAPSPAMLAYEVASPLWSDGASKRRWVVMPTKPAAWPWDESIAWSATGNWSFPTGTILVKHFEISVDERDPSRVKRLETRVMVCTGNDGKYGLTYRWNAEGTDAVLLEGGEAESFTVTDATGTPEQRTWSYPSRANCMECHTHATGHSIGLRTHQLNLTVVPPGEDAINQLAWFNKLGLFHPAPTDVELNAAIQARAIDDESAPLEHRVRSYLDSNCAHCHQPGGSVPHFDARLQTPLKDQALVNGIIRGQYHLPGGAYIKPGNPALSAVHVRNASTAPGTAMPPLGRGLVDQQASALIAEYIQGLSSAEFENAPSHVVRYVRIGTSLGRGSWSLSEVEVLDSSGVPLPMGSVTVAATSSANASRPGALAIDGDPSTYWESTFSLREVDHSIILDLGTPRAIGGIRFLPRPFSSAYIYTAKVSSDNATWSALCSGSVESNSGDWVHNDDPRVHRPVRVSIAAVPHSFAALIPLTVVFDSPVTDFTLSDLTVTGASAVAGSLRGSGYYYTVLLKATSPQVVVSVGENQVSAGRFGSRVSNVATVQTDLAGAVAASFLSPSLWNYGTFELRVGFDQPYSGLKKEDFTVANGKLEWMLEDASGVRLVISRGANSTATTITLKDDAVVGQNGLWMGKGISWTSTHYQSRLGVSPISFLRYGFTAVSDPDSPRGMYLWVPEGRRGGVTYASDSYKVLSSSAFSVSHPGSYLLRGSTRADDPGSDSFHVRLPGANVATVLPWQTNQGPGEIGSMQFHSGFARPAGGPSHVFELSDGPQELELYAAEDGTRIDYLELVPVRPFPLWQALPMVPEGLQAKLTFTSEVEGLEPADFEVVDGTVISVTGSGRNYVVTVRPSTDKVLLHVKENAVNDAITAAPGIKSLPFIAKIEEWTYEEWASRFAVPGGDSNLNRDNDRDGIGQLMEFALGLNPTASDIRTVVPGDHAKHGLPTLVMEDGPGGKQLVLVYHRRLGGTPLTYTAEFGSSPDDLAPVEVIEEVTPLSLQWEEVRVREAGVPVNGRTRFARLRVEKEAL